MPIEVIYGILLNNHFLGGTLMTPSTFTTESIDHLGIVAGICHQIGIVETTDTFIGQTNRKVSVGQAVVAMILNALGFVSRPLYLTPEFFSNKPVSLLIHPQLQASDFNDDSLGRALDTLILNEAIVKPTRVLK